MQKPRLFFNTNSDMTENTDNEFHFWIFNDLCKGSYVMAIKVANSSVLLCLPLRLSIYNNRSVRKTIVAEMIHARAWPYATTLRGSCDNQSVIPLAKNFMFHKRTKHIDVWYHWIRDALEDMMFDVNKVHIDEMVSICGERLWQWQVKS
ncbi:hypothetical protein OSB04_029962 [Centaurea solstitialis]|uniref:Uncharacterized protein n=1 Tax=Centaurea solstitialis TaxID=347529 RepID=A0AA38W4H4_9ASTR|nr:hypothetical protein OSB04_029962 [Centaurea solstitialis]